MSLIQRKKYYIQTEEDNKYLVYLNDEYNNVIKFWVKEYNMYVECYGKSDEGVYKVFLNSDNLSEQNILILNNLLLLCNFNDFMVKDTDMMRKIMKEESKFFCSMGDLLKKYEIRECEDDELTEDEGNI